MRRKEGRKGGVTKNPSTDRKSKKGRMTMLCLVLCGEDVNDEKGNRRGEEKRGGKERKGKERKGKERKGKEREGLDILFVLLACLLACLLTYQLAYNLPANPI